MWELELTEAGHLQFVDNQPTFFTLFSAGGTTPDVTVRAITQVGGQNGIQGACDVTCVGRHVTCVHLLAHQYLAGEGMWRSGVGHGRVGGLTI